MEVSKKTASIVAKFLVNEDKDKFVRKLALALEHNNRLFDFFVDGNIKPDCTYDEVENKVRTTYPTKSFVEFYHETVEYIFSSNFRWTVSINAKVKKYYKSEEDRDSNPYYSSDVRSDDYPIEYETIERYSITI